MPGTTLQRVPEARESSRASVIGACSVIATMPFSVLISGKLASGEKPFSGRPIFRS